MPHAIPPGPYCPPDIHRAGIMMQKVCEENGIPTCVRVPLLVWHLTNLAVRSNLNPAETQRCWELARMVLAEASERMRADKLAGAE